MGRVHRVVLTESAEQVVAYIRREPKRLDEKHDDGLTPLMLCLAHGRAEIGRVLVELGADVSLTDRRGGTALMLAAHRGFTDVTRLLLKRGAEVNATDTVDGFSAMDLALLGKHRDVVAILREAGGLAKVMDDDESGV